MWKIMSLNTGTLNIIYLGTSLRQDTIAIILFVRYIPTE